MMDMGKKTVSDLQCIDYNYIKRLIKLKVKVKMSELKANKTAGYGAPYYDGRTLMELSSSTHTGDKLNRSSSVLEVVRHHSVLVESTLGCTPHISTSYLNPSD